MRTPYSGTVGLAITPLPRPDVPVLPDREGPEAAVQAGVDRAANGIARRGSQSSIRTGCAQTGREVLSSSFSPVITRFFLHFLGRTGHTWPYPVRSGFRSGLPQALSIWFCSQRSRFPAAVRSGGGIDDAPAAHIRVTDGDVGDEFGLVSLRGPSRLSHDARLVHLKKDETTETSVFSGEGGPAVGHDRHHPRTVKSIALIRQINPA